MNANTSRSGGAVKPGDLAMVCALGNPNHGRIVDVIDIASSTIFRMPCGHYTQVLPEHWPAFVCKGVGGKLDIPRSDGGHELCAFAVFSASVLRPLPGDDVPEVERHAEEVET